MARALKFIESFKKIKEASAESSNSQMRTIRDAIKRNSDSLQKLRSQYHKLVDEKKKITDFDKRKRKQAEIQKVIDSAKSLEQANDDLRKKMKNLRGAK